MAQFFNITQAPASPIKSVQRGSITKTFSSGGATATATIAAVDMSKAVLIFTGGAPTSASDNTAWQARWGVRLDLTNATTVTLTRGQDSSETATVVVNFQVVEYH